MNIHLLIYEYAYKHSDRGVSYDEILEFLTKKKYNVDDPQVRQTAVACVSDIFGHNSFLYGGETMQKTVWPMAPQAYFNFLDYIELQETRRESGLAREEAFHAQTTAIIAIAVGIVVGLAQIAISAIELFKG